MRERRGWRPARATIFALPKRDSQTIARAQRRPRPTLTTGDYRSRMSAMQHHEGPSVSPAGWIAVADRLLRGCVWLIRRPFIAPQWLWAALTITAITGALGTFIADQLLPAAVLALIGFLPALVWLQWWILGRGDEPVVVVSLYRGGTFDAREAAGSQLHSLRRFLSDDEYIADAGGAIVRTVSVPIAARDARRLLALRAVVLVIRGQAEAGGDAGYFRGEAFLPRRRPDDLAGPL